MDSYLETLWKFVEETDSESEEERARQQAQADKALDELAELYRVTPNPFTKRSDAEVQSRREAKEAKRAANREAWRRGKRW